LDLLPLDFSSDTVVVTFYRKGEVVRKVRISDVIRELANLELTASHYRWGRMEGFDADGHFVIRTVEDRALAFDVDDGDIVREYTKPYLDTNTVPR